MRGKGVHRDKRLEFAHAIIADKTLTEILSVFEKEDIAVSPLKGAFLRHILYSDPFERIMTDIDLLVRKRDFRRAAKVLESLGMKEDCSSEIVKHPRAYSHSHYYRDGSPLIELHRAVAPLALENDFEDLLFSGRSAKYPTALFDFKCVHLPPPEIQLLILAMHFREHHLAVENHQIEDVSRLCRLFDMDKGTIKAMCDKFKCEFALWLLLNASGDEKAIDISEYLNPPRLRKFMHSRLFNSVDGGFHLKNLDDASRRLTLASRTLIHGVYSRDSLFESAAAHLKMLLFMLKIRLS